tara:strand:+ start:86 stop:628 length:543 start_codon:yes stop_codon:yes gene_type:complete
MAYKQPSSGPFKMMGSSPAKQDKGNFNLTGDSKSTTPGYSTTKAAKVAKEAKSYTNPSQGVKKAISKKGSMPKNFNITGDKASTTPKYNTKKAAKSNMKANTKMLKQVPRAKTKMLKQVVKKGAGKLVGAALGPVVGLAGMAYGAYKSGQEHSGGKAVKGQKSFMADAKKNTKSIYSKKK